MPAISMFSKCIQTPGQIIVPPTANKNWQPGNYIASTTENNDTIWSQNTGVNGTEGIVQRLQRDTARKWQGALLRFYPSSIEAGFGDYNAGLDKIEAYLDQIAALSARRLVLFFSFRSFNANTHVVPNYMIGNATYQGGEYGYPGGPNSTAGGNIACLHDPEVLDRFIAMFDALATRFNSNPYIEAIAFAETSLVAPIGNPGFNFTPWYNNLMALHEGIRPAFSNIQISQWINSPRNVVKDFVADFNTIGTGLGMTDACPDDVGFNFRNDIPGQSGTPPGNIQHFQDNAGKYIIMTHCSKQALCGSVAGRGQLTAETIQGQPRVYPVYPGTGGRSRQIVHDFCVDDCKATHIMWAHNTGRQPSPGDRDPAANNPGGDNTPPFANAYEAISDAISGTYANKYFNQVTDAWIQHASSDILTNSDRPIGWD